MAPAIPLIALAITAIGTGYGVVSSMSQAAAAKSSANYNAAVANNNAIAAQQQSTSDQQQIQRSNYLALSSQTAAYGASGVDPYSGSPLDIGLDSQIQGNYNLLARKYQGDVAAGNYTAQAGLDQSEGDNAATQAEQAAGTSLLTGAGTAIKQVNQFYPTQTTNTNYSGSTSPTFNF